MKYLFGLHIRTQQKGGWNLLCPFLFYLLFKNKKPQYIEEMCACEFQG